MQDVIRNSQATLYHQQGDVYILLGDSRNPHLFDRAFIDLIITSPPYNVGLDYRSTDDEISYEEYLEFSRLWMANCYAWSKPSARFCLNIPLDKNKGGQRSVGADLTVIAQEVGWRYHATIVWNEGNISRRTAWGSWMSASAPYVIAPVELIWCCTRRSGKSAGDRESRTSRERSFWSGQTGCGRSVVKAARRSGIPRPFPGNYPAVASNCSVSVAT